MAQGAASEAAGGGRQERVQRGSRKHRAVAGRLEEHTLMLKYYELSELLGRLQSSVVMVPLIGFIHLG